MPLPQLIMLGVVAMAGLAVLRLIRVHLGRSPLPEGRGRRLFLVAFVVLPPIALAALTQPAEAGPPPGIASLPIYIAIVAGLWALMALAATIIERVTYSRASLLLRLALVGNAGDPDDVRSDPAVTARLAESVDLVDRANTAFPRGPAFPAQVGRVGFRADWDELDGATRTLEDRIADDHRRGLAVASAATATATDARSRLDTLRRLAVDHGQAWAAV